MGRARDDDARPLLDAESFRRAVIDHGRAVHRYLASRLGPDAAEDAMSETFAEAWKARAKFVDDTAGGVEAWLIRVASYVVSGQRRQEQRWLRMKADAAREQLADAAIGDVSLIDADERIDAEGLMRRARLAEAIVEMPRREREPLLMYVVDGRPYPEIAHILELPIGTVRSRISRGKQRLAAHVQRTGERR